MTAPLTTSYAALAAPDVGETVLAVSGEWNGYLETLERLAPTEWDTQTRCAGWRVRDLVAHTVWGVSMEADALARARTAAEGAGTGTEVSASLPPDDLLTAMRTSWRELSAELAALADPGADARTVEMPYGPVALVDLLSVLTMEAGVHTSDLAAAVGEDASLALDVARATFVTMAGFWPVLASAAAPPDEPVAFDLVGPTSGVVASFDDGGWAAVAYDPSIPGTGDPNGVRTARLRGMDSDLALVLTGRLTTGDAPIVVEGDADLAARLKDYLPGP